MKIEKWQEQMIDEKLNEYKRLKEELNKVAYGIEKTIWEDDAEGGIIHLLLLFKVNELKDRLNFYNSEFYKATNKKSDTEEAKQQ